MKIGIFLKQTCLLKTHVFFLKKIQVIFLKKAHNFFLKNRLSYLIVIHHIVFYYHLLGILGATH
jgi:hypothetical protein